MIEEYMYKIVELAADVIEANMALLYIGIFAAKDNLVSKWRKILCAFCGIGIMCFLLDQMALVSVYKTLIVLLGNYICSVCIFKVKWKKVLFWEIIYVAVSLIFEMFVILGMQYTSGIDINSSFEWGLQRTTIVIIEKLIWVFMVLLLYKVLAHKDKIQIDKRFEKIAMFICLVMIVMLLLFWIYSNTGKYVEIVTLSFLLISIATILFMVYSMFVITENVEKQRHLEMMQMQNEVLQQSLMEIKNGYEHWQKQIHDYKNTIICLNSMLTDSDSLSVKKYLEKEMEQIDKAAHIVSCGNTMLDSILNLKWVEAEQKNVFFSVQGGRIDKLPVAEIELGRLMGNLLDNAIEGAVYSGMDAYVEVVLKQVEEELTIEITNSAIEEKIDFSKTSKKEKNIHGIGLQSIKEIVEKNNGIFEIEQIGNRVIARIEF